jgi:hypothetical protein
VDARRAARDQVSTYPATVCSPVNANWDLLVPNQSGGSRGPKKYSVNLRRRRDAQMLRALHDEHAHSLLLYVVGLTRERVIAQDIVQETPAPSVAQRGSARTDRRLRATLVVHGGQAHRQRPMALGGSRAEFLTGMVPEHAVPDTVRRPWTDSSCAPHYARCRSHTGGRYSNVTSAAHLSPKPRAPSAFHPAPSSPASTTHSARYDKKSTRRGRRQHQPQTDRLTGAQPWSPPQVRRRQVNPIQPGR